MKKTIALILTLLCVLSLLSPVAFAEKVQKQSYVCTKEVEKDSTGSKTTTRTYDSKGNLTKESVVEKSLLFGNDSNSTEYTYDSKGKVTKIVYISGSGSLKETETTIYTYDSKGRTTKIERSDKTGSTKTGSSLRTYTFDDKGNMIKSYEKETDSFSGTVTNTTTNTYDSKKNLTKSVVVYVDDEGKTTSTFVYTYDSKGRITKVSETGTDYIFNGKFTTISEFTYNSKDCITKQVITTTAAGYKNVETTTNTYDSKSNLTKSVVSCKINDAEEGDSTYTSTTAVTYDSKGNVLKNYFDYSSSIGERRTDHEDYTYNDAGLCIKKVDYEADEDGKSTETTTTTYDSKNRVVKEVVKTNTSDFENPENSGTENTTVTYAYDSKGNVIKSTETYAYKTEIFSFNNTTVTTNTYDSNGNVTKKVVTENGDFGKDTTTTTFEYAKAKKAIYHTLTGLEYSERTYKYDATQTYTGKEIKPEVIIVDAFNENLLKGVDYELSYLNNIKVGKGKITVKFIGDYEGIADTVLSFNIVKPTPQVKGLKAETVKKDSIKLTWTKLSGAKYYKVERYDSANKKWVAVKTVETNSYTVSNLKAGTKYSYRVTGLDSSKKKLGNPSATLKTQTLCSAPSVKLTSTKSKTATVSWSKVTGASKYVVYTSTDGKKFTKVGDTTKTSYTLSKLSAGKKIYVKVYATNAYSKNSSASAVKNVTVKK